MKSLKKTIIISSILLLISTPGCTSYIKFNYIIIQEEPGKIRGAIEIVNKTKKDLKVEEFLTLVPCKQRTPDGCFYFIREHTTGKNDTLTNVIDYQIPLWYFPEPPVRKIKRNKKERFDFGVSQFYGKIPPGHYKLIGCFSSSWFEDTTLKNECFEEYIEIQ